MTGTAHSAPSLGTARGLRSTGHRSIPLDPGARSWLKENLERSLPFLLGGALCVGLGVWIDVSRAYEGVSRFPFGLLLASVGVVLCGGGSALTLVEEADLTEVGTPRDGYVVVPQAEWERLRGEANVPYVSKVAGAATPVASAGAVGVREGIRHPSPVGVDPALVSQVSDDLVRGARATSQPPAPTPESSTAPGPPASAASPTGPGGIGTPPALSRSRGGTRPLSSLSPAPAAMDSTTLQEAAIHEFESVLSELGQAPAAAPTAPSRPPPSSATDRCVSCGALVTAYSEQICVVCDRPLCDKCLDQTALEAHPAVCAACHGSISP
jgi:hypothetical protein